MAQGHHVPLSSILPPLGLFFVPKAKRLFEAAIEANPSHAESLGNLAVLLHGQPCASAAMLDKIEGLYKRAVHADPANANNFSNFGLFLAEVNSSSRDRCLPHALGVIDKPVCVGARGLLQTIPSTISAIMFRYLPIYLCSSLP